MPHWFTVPFLVFLYFFAVWAPILLVLVVIVWWFTRVTPAQLVRPNAYIDDFAPPPDAPVSYGPFTEADVDEVFQIEAALFKYTVGLDLPHYYNTANRFGFTAKIAGRVVGFILCRRYRSGLVIQQLAVHTNARRRGIARRLMEDAIAVARQERSPVVALWVRRNDTQAFPLYQSMGFVITGREKLALKMTLALPGETAEQAAVGVEQHQASPS
jgi:ribosomal protein S18 acetylase RimI-like enzyme